VDNHGRPTSRYPANPNGSPAGITGLTSQDGEWFGQIVNPETGTTYNTRMQLTASKTWRLDGCTASNVCLSGEFVRVE
jgi:phosphoribosylformylglycinamidine synthase